MATVTLTKLIADPGEAPSIVHSTRLLIRESHLEAIQRKHGMSLIKWLETALEIELEALTDAE